MIIGIDLGTTNSLVGCFKDGKPEIFRNRLGKKLTPSVVAIDEKDNILVGELAKEYSYLHPECAASAFKRTIGTDYKYKLKGKEYNSKELSSFVLRSLKEDAEVALGTKIEKAIISVPAYFNDLQRKQTKEAGELAGLEVVRIINEPTASALAYGVGQQQSSERCLVFDLGGGTFDVSILEYYHSIMEVHAIAGDNHLGGEDFTVALMELFASLNGFSLELLDGYSLSQLYKACEKAKCEFSIQNEVTINCLIKNSPYCSVISLQMYKEACKELIEKLKMPIEKAMRDAKVTLNDLDRIILVGGATRLPLIGQFIQESMNMWNNYLVNPDESVVTGAILQCGMKERDKAIEEVILTDVCPFTLGTEVIHNNGLFDEDGHFLPIIERNTIIPVSKKETVYTAHDNQEEVRVKVLQGESRYAANNVKIGELLMKVPKGPKGEQAIEITYTYDVNALLEVEVRVVSTNEQKKIIIQNQNNKISEREAQQRMELLSYLKQNPRENEENYYVLTKGERLCEELLGNERDEVERLLFEFERVMVEGTRLDIEHKRKELNERFEQLDNHNDFALLS